MQAGPDQRNRSNRNTAVLQPEDQESLGQPKEAEGGQGEERGPEGMSCESPVASRQRRLNCTGPRWIRSGLLPTDG